MWTELIGGLAATITTLCWLPQAIHILRRREAGGVSLAANAAFAAGLALWLIYGVLISSLPLIGANAVSLMLVLAIIALKLRFGMARAR